MQLKLLKIAESPHIEEEAPESGTLRDGLQAGQGTIRTPISRQWCTKNP